MGNSNRRGISGEIDRDDDYFGEEKKPSITFVEFESAFIFL